LVDFALLSIIGVLLKGLFNFSHDAYITLDVNFRKRYQVQILFTHSTVKHKSTKTFMSVRVDSHERSRKTKENY
jgi:hypothetical protein